MGIAASIITGLGVAATVKTTTTSTTSLKTTSSTTSSKTTTPIVTTTTSHTTTTTPKSSTTTSIIVTTTTSKTTTTTPKTTTTTTTSSSASPTSTSCAQLAAISANFTSGSNTYTLACSNDIPNYGDISNAAASSFYNCFAGCDSVSGCQAFTYLDGICYYKNFGTGSYSLTPLSGRDFAYNPKLWTPASSSSTTSSTTTSTTTTAAPTTTSATTTVVSSSTTLTTTTPSTTTTSSTTSSSTTSSTSSMSSSTTVSAAAATATPSLVAGGSVANTILVFAKDADSAYTAYSGLEGYGIPYSSIIVPSTGVTLPVLNSSATVGNYGGIIVHAEVSYDYGTSTASNWSSALTAAQWQQLYDYQVSFGVRMVRLDVYPGATTDTTVVSGGCCSTGVTQDFSFTDVSAFSSAGLVTGATLSTTGLYHYPASITNTTRTTQIAKFGASSDGVYASDSVAAVINNFDGRQQMAYFTSFATSWSVLSNYAQHSWIHWMTRGVFAGRRRTLLSTQIDDIHLITDLYSPSGSQYRCTTADLAAHITWMADINSRLPSGSNYMIELAHNGNGDIENATASNAGATACVPDTAIEYDAQTDTALEFQKALGTGADIWPTTPTSYVWTSTCAVLDPLAAWFTTASNRDAFMHVSHTFSHMSLNNATYSDTNKEISFNAAWMKQISIASATHFSANGLVPPAITGLHNGDAIKAWMDNGITAVVGDNTRSVLMNQNNEYWPLITTVASNGYAGLTIVPRWATTIYYNCDFAACTLAEWIATSAGSGDFANLLVDATATNVRHLLGLHQDPFMFHQANLRRAGAATYTVGSVTGTLSLLQIWVETITQELMRLTTWAVVTLKHDDIATEFTNRMTRDACNYNLAWNKSTDGKTITSVTVSSTSNTCGAPIPVTFPGDASGSGTKDKIGNDPLIMWVTLSGSPVTLTLATPVAV